MEGVTGSIPVAPTIVPDPALTEPPQLLRNWPNPPILYSEPTMKVRNSLKSLRSRHRDNRLVRRKGRLYIINKTQGRFKARQG